MTTGARTGTWPPRLLAWVGCTRCYLEGQLTGSWAPAARGGDVVGMGLADAWRDLASRRTSSVCRVCSQDDWRVFDWAFEDQSWAELLPGECTTEQAQQVAAAVRLRARARARIKGRLATTRDVLCTGLATLVGTGSAWAAACGGRRTEITTWPQ